MLTSKILKENNARYAASLTWRSATICHKPTVKYIPLTDVIKYAVTLYISSFSDAHWRELELLIELKYIRDKAPIYENLYSPEIHTVANNMREHREKLN